MPKIPTVQPPRPPNSWILFRKDMAPVLKARNGGKMNQSELSTAVAEEWKHISASEKAKYEAKAEAAKQHHRLLYPDYVYQPKSKEEKERLKSDIRAKKVKDKADARRSRPPYDAPYPLPQPVASSSSVSQPSPAQYLPDPFFDPWGPSPPMSANASPEPSGSDGSTSTNASSQPQSQPSQTPSPVRPTTLELPSSNGSLALPGSQESFITPTAAWDPTTPASPSQQLWAPQPSEMLTFNIDPGQEWANSTAGLLQDPFSTMFPGSQDPDIFRVENFNLAQYDSQAFNFDPMGILGNSELTLNVDQGTAFNQDFNGFYPDNLGYTDLAQLFESFQPSTNPSDMSMLMPETADYLHYPPVAELQQPSPYLAPATNSPAHTPPAEAVKTPYYPPAGAGNSSSRRVGASWGRTFAVSDDETHL